ncbi:PDR/VanB family oxidoreductase [Nitrincola sp.]|uniref:PDR/VanB family oxidoreductase n=1 Tax=Nitrincola sp. TaxID=1926584 RepID=UPI003A8D0E82
MKSSAIQVTVSRIASLTPVIKEFTLTPIGLTTGTPTGTTLPGFSPGSHIQIELPTPTRTLKNAYSLLSDPADLSCYRIAVRLQEGSRGGSRYLHEAVKEGDTLHITPPANLFAPSSMAQHHILIAGGIGITPFMAYRAEMQRQGISHELHYAYTGGLTHAYVEPLLQVASGLVSTYDSTRGERLDIEQILSGQPLGAQVYICGPERLLQAVQQTAHALGWSEGRVHWEAFAAPEPGQPFHVYLAKQDKTLAVSADESLLEALEAARIEHPNLCRGGVCGQCAAPYLSGQVEHRDSYLPPSDQSHLLMPCVSRGACDSTLVLDL